MTPGYCEALVQPTSASSHLIMLGNCPSDGSSRASPRAHSFLQNMWLHPLLWSSWTMASFSSMISARERRQMGQVASVRRYMNEPGVYRHPSVGLTSEVWLMNMHFIHFDKGLNQSLPWACGPRSAWRGGQIEATHSVALRAGTQRAVEESISNISPRSTAVVRRWPAGDWTGFMSVGCKLERALSRCNLRLKFTLRGKETSRRTLGGRRNKESAIPP